LTDSDAGFRIGEQRIERSDAVDIGFGYESLAMNRGRHTGSATSSFLELLENLFTTSFLGLHD
jgi:hypothetical protein